MYLECFFVQYDIFHFMLIMKMTIDWNKSTNIVYLEHLSIFVDDMGKPEKFLQEAQ